MELAKGDIRHGLSRRMQDFHESDPATQAALRGEEYFEVTAGHLLSGALESGYFDTLEECLNFFELERDVLKRKDSFSPWEVRQLEDKIFTDADERLGKDESAPYEAWADWFIEASTVPEDSRDKVLEEILLLADEANAEQKTRDYADALPENWTSTREYHKDLHKMQISRLLELMANNGFATTVLVAAESFVATGLIDSGEDEIDQKYALIDIKRRLGVAAYNGVRREVEGGYTDLEDFDESDWEDRFKHIDGEDFAYWAEDGHPIVLSAKDLRMFASHYAAPDETKGIPNDEKYQTLLGLIKNTPERIQEVRDHIAYLRR